MTNDKSKESELLGDLESIRTLLNDADESPATNTQERSDAAEEQVPLLDDIVDDCSLGDDEAPVVAPVEESADDATTDDGGIDQELFDALLGDSWKETAAELLKETRATIERSRSHWSPQDIDDLNNALHTRLDATLRNWLRLMVQEHIDDLRVSLLEATRTEIEGAVEKFLDDNPEEE
jgi:hypothetical protein